MNKLKAVITVGCSCSGKSTWAKTQTGWYQIERDKIRQEVLIAKTIPFNNMWEVWNWKWEDIVTAQVNVLIQTAIDSNLNIIISDTNLNRDRRVALVEKLMDLGFDVETKVFGEDLSLEDLWKRDNFRQHSVGFQTIAKQYQQFRKENPRFGIYEDVAEELDKCILCDIDGTLTLGAFNRSPFEWDKVDQDLPNEVVVSAIRGLWRDGYRIIFMSGRDSVCREKTIKWIDDAFREYIGFGISQPEIEYDLFMRKQDDMRKDYIVKTELYFEHIDGQYRVEGVFDDRPQVIRNVWQEMGFNVISVGNQYIEF